MILGRMVLAKWSCYGRTLVWPTAGSYIATGAACGCAVIIRNSYITPQARFAKTPRWPK